MFYRNRKKLKNKSIHLDLTKSRLSLLNEARKLIENNEDIAFCYTDINCCCKLRFKNNDDFFFESLDVLKSKLSGYSNSVTAQNFSKLTQLKAYISTYKYDFICLSKTFLDSSTPDNLVDIQGYNLVRTDHLDNTKRGGVCIYYKEPLLVRVINLPYFKETLLLDMSFYIKKVIVSVIYRSPGQNSNQFELFLSNLENFSSDINNRKSSLSVVTGDFNAVSPPW